MNTAYVPGVIGQASMKILMLTVVLDLVAFLAVAEAGAPQSGFKEYPLKTCLVGGEKLGSMGRPFQFKYQGRVIQLCCKGCLGDFKKTPDKFVGKLAETSPDPSPSRELESKP